jgi:sirohydrochlorin cobaltochelatase
MKNKTVKALALAMAVATVTMMGSASIYASDDTAEAATEETADTEEDADADAAEDADADAAEDADAADTEEASDDDQKAADEVAALIDKIYVQERNDTTDEDCKAAKEAWDKLTDAQKELVEGEEASPEYFGADTGDASKDDPRNQDEIGENELLVVSFGTSFNDSRAQDIKGIEDKLQEAYPDWSVRRAFTAQIIINHVEARDDEVIDNMDQALDRAVANGVKNLVVQPTHLMHGAEYDEMTEAIDGYKDKFESVAIAEPMLGEVGDDATVINDDKKAVAQAITDEACKIAGYDSMEAAAEDGTAFVFMGHGTSHTANVTYDQMQTQMDDLGFTNAFIGTVEGEPEDTECQAVIAKVKDAGFKKVVLRPLMVVAGDHANNDMAGDDEDSWKSQFEASGAFDSIDCQIEGLGRIEAVEDLYVEHTKAAIDSLGADAEAATDDAEAEATDDTAADDAAETTEEAAE